MSKAQKQKTEDRSQKTEHGIQNIEDRLQTTDNRPQIIDPASPEAMLQQTAPIEKKEKYAFPTVSACPRCRATDTIATSTQGRVQYRRCRRAICRQTYTVIGKKV